MRRLTYELHLDHSQRKPSKVLASGCPKETQLKNLPQLTESQINTSQWKFAKPELHADFQKMPKNICKSTQVHASCKYSQISRITDYLRSTSVDCRVYIRIFELDQNHRKSLNNAKQVKNFRSLPLTCECVWLGLNTHFAKL